MPQNMCICNKPIKSIKIWIHVLLFGMWRILDKTLVIHDWLWSYVCISNDSRLRWLASARYVIGCVWYSDEQIVELIKMTSNKLVSIATMQDKNSRITMTTYVSLTIFPKLRYTIIIWTDRAPLQNHHAEGWGKLAEAMYKWVLLEVS